MTHSPLPRGVVALGLVSLFMDISSEMIHSLMAVFCVSVLGASALSVGIIEGIAVRSSRLRLLLIETAEEEWGLRCSGPENRVTASAPPPSIDIGSPD